ncbi:MAG TPA: oligosaccharide flippase family protein [Polyangia bacterium]
MPEVDQGGAEAAQGSSIAHKAVSGAMWSTAAGLVARALSLVGTVLIVRFLTPSEYGEIQSASVVVLTASQFATLGVGPYIISFPRSGRVVAFHATLIHATLGALALILTWAFADKVGGYFDAPTLQKFVPGLAAAVFLDRLSFMAERPVVRDLGFRTVSASRTVGELAYTIVSVFFAWRGHGAMSVVYGNVARSILRLVVMLIMSDWREWAQPARIDRAVLSTLFSYGTVVTVESIAEFGSRRWDNLLVARYFGSGVTGNYVLAYNLADLPSIQIGEQISDVLLASYGHVDPEHRPAAVLRAATLMTLIMAPLSIGLGAIGPSIAHAFFPPEWILLGPMLTLLPIVLVSRPIGAVYSGFLMIVRGPKPPMVGEVVAVVLMMVTIVLFARTDPMMVVAMVGLSSAARTLVFMWYVQKTDGVTIMAGLRRFLPIFAACIPMFAAVWGVRQGLLSAGIDRPLLSLPLEITAGAIAYVLFVLLLSRGPALDMLTLVLGVLRRKLRR